jgi:iron complex transport system ATP-binding protein
MKPRALAARVAVVRQQAQASFDFTVLETVLMARMHQLDWCGFERPEDREIVNHALHMTETFDLAQRTLHHLSGGEQQRVFIARALAQSTDILLLDEPTTHLDLRHQVTTYDLLKRAQREQHKTVVAITHDINLAMQYCDTMILLSTPPGSSEGSQTPGERVNDCRLWIGPPEDVLTEDRIEAVFGVAVHVMEKGGRRFFAPRGQYTREGCG